MSKTIEILKEVKDVLQLKFEGATIQNPTYFRSGDIDSTQHIYSLVTTLANGRVLEIKTYTNFIPFCGADYKFEVSVTANSIVKTFVKEVSRNDITTLGIINYLRELGLKV